MRIKIEQFGDDYFYTLGLNNKFCDGIRKFNENKTNVALYSKEILDLVNKWRAVNCSQEGYGVLALDLEEREKNATMMKEYNTVWERRFFIY